MGFVGMRVILNDDAVLVAAIRRSLKKNGGYCPCAVEKTDDMKCMCKEFRNQDSPGECQCGLYVKIQDERNQTKGMSNMVTITDKEKQAAVKEFEKGGVTKADLAKKYNTSPRSIGRWIDKYGSSAKGSNVDTDKKPTSKKKPSPKKGSNNKKKVDGKQAKGRAEQELDSIMSKLKECLDIVKSMM